MSSKHYNRPSSSYTGEAGLTQRTKYQTDSNSTPKVPISSSKVDGDLNYMIDALNEIFDSITAGTVLDGSITTAKLADAAVTVAKMANLAALSVIGNATIASAAPAAIAAGSDGLVLRRDGTAIGFGQVATAGIADGQVTYAKIQNVNNAKLLGRSTVGAGSVEELSLGTGLDLTAGVLSAPLKLQKYAQEAAGSFTFTTSANITTATVFRLYLTGGGGGGGQGSSVNGGGGAGATLIVDVTGLSPSTGYTGSVGAAGNGAASPTNGGDTTITIGATTYTAGGGVAAGAVGAGGLGGTVSGGDRNLAGGDGQPANPNSNPAGTGGASYYGGGGRGTPNSSTGSAGRAWGSGGGGGSNNNSGAGAHGAVYIEWLSV